MYNSYRSGKRHYRPGIRRVRDRRGKYLQRRQWKKPYSYNQSSSRSQWLYLLVPSVYPPGSEQYASSLETRIMALESRISKLRSEISKEDLSKSPFPEHKPSSEAIVDQSVAARDT